MEDQFLSHFITEDLYITPQDAIENRPSPQEQEKEYEENQRTAAAEEPSIPTHYSFVVVSEAISESERELLTKILSAVGQDIKETTFLLEPVAIDFTYDKMLIFGSKPLPEKSTDLYKVVKDEGQLLRSRKLQDIAVSQEEKSKLWNTLKTLFSL